MASYYNASIRIGGPIPEGLILDLIQAIDADDPVDCDLNGMDAASFVGEFIETECESRAWGDYRNMREFCNEHGIAYDLDSGMDSGGSMRFCNRPHATPPTELDGGWPLGGIDLIDGEPAIQISRVLEIVDAHEAHTSRGIIGNLRALCQVPPELEPITLVESEVKA